MAASITLYGFDTSNNMKVRVALGYKGIHYRFVEVDLDQRAELQRISGQSLTPVLVHGEVVLFDSAAILRYLDANFRATPPLFAGTVAEAWQVEDWELFARAELARPMMDVVHTRRTAGHVDEAVVARSQRAFDAAVERLAAALRGRQWLVGEAMTGADVTAAPVMRRVRNAALFELPAAAEALRDWEERVMAYDGVGREDA